MKITTKSQGKIFQTKSWSDRSVEALVKSNQDNLKVMLEQNDLETVIPAVGRQILVLNGKFLGYKAVFEKLDVDNFESTLKLCDKNILVTLTYDHFSKLGSADSTTAAGSGLIVTIE